MRQDLPCEFQERAYPRPIIPHPEEGDEAGADQDAHQLGDIELIGEEQRQDKGSVDGESTQQRHGGRVELPRTGHIHEASTHGDPSGDGRTGYGEDERSDEDDNGICHVSV